MYAPDVSIRCFSFCQTAQHRTPLVELENGSMSLARIQEKYQRYERWMGSGAAKIYLQKIFAAYGQRPSDSSLRLLVVVHADGTHAADERRLIDLLLPALTLPSRLRRLVWLTTAAALKYTRRIHCP